MTDINISNLVVNKLTWDQFKQAKAQGQINEESEIYIITDLSEQVYTKTEVDALITAAIEAAFADIARAENTSF